jgi:hypothetical protein
VIQGIGAIARPDEPVCAQHAKHIRNFIVSHQIAIPDPSELPGGCGAWRPQEPVGERFVFFLGCDSQPLTVSRKMIGARSI